MYVCMGLIVHLSGPKDIREEQVTVINVRAQIKKYGAQRVVNNNVRVSKRNFFPSNKTVTKMGTVIL